MRNTYARGRLLPLMEPFWFVKMRARALSLLSLSIYI
jgi:hypothetical protein